MSEAALRSIERLHGAIAWAAAAALVLSAWIALRGRASRRWQLGAGAAAIGLLAAATASGLALHEPYRARLRQRVFLASAALGWLFERKQHAAFGAVLLGIAGLAVNVAALRVEHGPLGRDLRRAARLAWIAAAALALAAAVASVAVAGRVSF